MVSSFLLAENAYANGDTGNFVVTVLIFCFEQIPLSITIGSLCFKFININRSASKQMKFGPIMIGIVTGLLLGLLTYCVTFDVIDMKVDFLTVAILSNIISVSCCLIGVVVAMRRS